MIHRALAIALVLLGPVAMLEAQVNEARPDSGTFLYEACQLRVRALDDSSFKPSPQEAARALICDSYIQGFTDGMISSSHDFCALPVTREQAIRKYISFLTKNPYLLQEDKLMGVALALQPLYRCPESKR